MRHILVSVQADRDPTTPYPYLSTHYLRAMAGAGLYPVLASGLSPEVQTQAADALLLTGGGDLTPGYYSYQVSETVLDFEEAVRDAQEFTLFRAFYQMNKPIFGICRGMQLINVALGGTLWEDLISQKRNLSHTDGQMHEIETVPDSWLYSLFGRKCVVNSFHHQACRRLATGLIESAQSADGVIEAFSHASRPIYGVQWHPERMVQPGGWNEGEMSRLFHFWKSVVEEAAGKQETGSIFG